MFYADTSKETSKEKSKLTITVQHFKETVWKSAFPVKTTKWVSHNLEQREKRCNEKVKHTISQGL